MNILHIDSGFNYEGSISRTLSHEIVQALKKQNPDAIVTYKDLDLHTPAYLSMTSSMAIRNGQIEGLSEKDRKEVVAINIAINELMNADVLVIGAPLYNFSIPACLKSWIDQVCQAGKTFTYTEKGPTGLVKGKKLFIASARGGFYQQPDFQADYLRTVLGFLGLTDVTTIQADGVAYSDDDKQKSMAQARAQIAQIKCIC